MLTRPSALGTLREQCDVLTKRIQKLEHDNQMAAFEYSKKVYLWERDRLQKERPLKEYNQRLNEHKAKVLSNVLSNLACLRKHINNVTKTVIEVDLEKAKLMVDGLDVTDETTEEQKMAKLKMRDKIEMALEKLQQSSYLKAEIDKMAKAGKICVKSLQSHVRYFVAYNSLTRAESRLGVRYQSKRGNMKRVGSLRKRKERPRLEMQDHIRKRATISTIINFHDFQNKETNKLKKDRRDWAFHKISFEEQSWESKCIFLNLFLKKGWFPITF